jgi:hypothetical protein
MFPENNLPDEKIPFEKQNYYSLALNLKIVLEIHMNE